MRAAGVFCDMGARCPRVYGGRRQLCIAWKYVAPGALDKTFGADGDVYGAVVMRLERAADEDAFSDDYDALVSSAVSRIERDVQAKREEARRDALQQRAQDELTRAKEQAYAEIQTAQAQLDAQRGQLDGQLKALDAQAAQVPVGMAMPEPLASTQRQWVQGDAQLKEAQQQLNTRKQEIDDRFAKEQQTVDDIAPRWYVQSRTALSGFSSLKSDISSIQSLGNAFPIVFLVVAVMMSLTTMRRLVEEDRGLIGTYLGLGYGRVTITLRYALFALLACLIGGVAGCAALILCGLAINDTVAALGPNQYRGVDQYDMFAMTNNGDEDELRGKLVEDGKTTAIMETRIESGEITNGEGSGTSVQLTIVPETQLSELNTMFRLEPARDDSIFGWLRNRGHDRTVTLNDDGIIVTQSAAQSLNVKAGDDVDLRGAGAQPNRVKVAAVTRSLIGAETFISEDLYHRLFPASILGEASDTEPAVTWNAVYAKLKRRQGRADLLCATAEERRDRTERDVDGLSGGAFQIRPDGGRSSG